MPNLWYKNAIIYCLDVETFMDSTGSGTGDFRGLADRLDHLERLGVNCIWLNPFYPSANRDNGYDVTDYYGVDPRFGTLGDFVEFMHAANDRGMRVIVDLVVNHTSVDHPWFQSARSDENSPYRDWYVWSEEKPENITDGVVFPGVQDAIWTYDNKAKAWYLHRFYKHQPDLNVANPEVREEILKIMGFWLALGVSGFRIDAVPFLIENKGLPDGGNDNPYHLLSDMHDFMAWRRAESILLAEANIEYIVAQNYFGAGDRMSMIFDFLLNQNMYLAFARKTAGPLRNALENRPDAEGMGQWTTFLRNHDELDLGRLSNQERQECFDAFGPEETMQIYDRGIRRRLAPMLKNDPARLRLAYSLMFALPGTPVLWYGEEIGMGENLDLKERDAVRTPMQWSSATNGGFSRSPKKDIVHAMKAKGPYGYETINVSSQIRDRNSLMQAITGMIQARRAAPEIGWGDCEIVDIGNDDVLVLSYVWRGYRVVTAHNFSDAPVSFKLNVDGVEYFESIMSLQDCTESVTPGTPLELGPYGYAWLRCDTERR